MNADFDAFLDFELTRSPLRSLCEQDEMICRLSPGNPWSEPAQPVAPLPEQQGHVHGSDTETHYKAAVPVQDSTKDDAGDAVALEALRKTCAAEFAYPSASSMELVVKRAAQVICERHLLVRGPNSVSKSRVLSSVPEALVLEQPEGLFSLEFDGMLLPTLPKASVLSFPYGTLQVEFFLNVLNKFARLDPVLDDSACLRCCKCNKTCAETPYLLTVDHQPHPQGARCRSDIDLEVHGAEDVPVQFPPGPFASAVNAETGHREGEAVCLGCLWLHWLLPNVARTKVLDSPMELREALFKHDLEVDGNADRLCRLLSDATGSSCCALQFSYVTQDRQFWIGQIRRTEATVALGAGTDLWKAHQAEPSAPRVEDINAEVRQRFGRKRSRLEFEGDGHQQLIQTAVDVACATSDAILSSRSTLPPPPQQQPLQQQQQHYELAQQQQQQQQQQQYDDTNKEPWKEAREFLVRVKEWMESRGGVIIPLPPNLPSIIYLCAFCGQPGHQNGRSCPLMHRSLNPSSRVSEPFENHLTTGVEKYAVDGGEWAKHSLSLVDVAIGLIDGIVATLNSYEKDERDKDLNALRSMDYMHETGQLLKRQLEVTDKESHWYDENQPYECLRTRNIRQCKNGDKIVFVTAWPVVPRAYLLDVAKSKEVLPCDVLDMTSFTSKSELEAAFNTLESCKWDASHVSHLIKQFSEPCIDVGPGDPSAISVFQAFEWVTQRVCSFIETTLDPDLDAAELAKAAEQITRAKYRNRKSAKTTTRKKPPTIQYKSEELRRYCEHVERAEASEYIKGIVSARDELFNNIIFQLFEADYRVSERKFTFPELGLQHLQEAIDAFNVHLRDIRSTAVTISGHHTAPITSRTLLQH